MPVNATPDEKIFLRTYQSFRFSESKIRYLKNAFVTSSGLVTGRNGLINECYHYKWNGQFYLFSVEALRYYNQAMSDEQKFMVFDNQETYLLIHHPWHANYYHWLNETLYRLWLIKDQADQMVLLLPDKDKLSAFALDSLKLFNFKNIIHIPDGNMALVETLCIPAQKPNMESYNSTALFELRKMYVNYVSSKPITANNLERIYVSRGKSSRRKIVNEDEVIDTMRKYNFSIIYCEDYTFYEQVALFSQTKYLVGNHGAGLTNMLFMPTGSIVFELLMKTSKPKRNQNFIYWYMSESLKLKYYHQYCEPTNPNESFFTADLLVDIELLNKNLNLIL